MHFHIPLPGGRLKIKTYRYLRSSEREGRARMWRCGSLYFIWDTGSRTAR